MDHMLNDLRLEYLNVHIYKVIPHSITLIRIRYHMSCYTCHQVHGTRFLDIQVVPGRAGGGSFKRKKNYIAKKEFAYRMCAR